jgi:competence protein ComEC
MLEVHVIGVGRGDAVFVRCPEGNHELLIDAGDNSDPAASDNFKAFLGAYQARDNMIERVIATHQHPSHIGNMKWVLQEYRVGLYVDNAREEKSPLYASIKETLGRRRIAYENLSDSAHAPDVDFCPMLEVTTRILTPYGFDEPSADPHARVLVVRIDYKKASFLFCGDANREEERMLIDDPDIAPLLRSDFLKLDFHGPVTGGSAEFLDTVKPRIVALSCGGREAERDGRDKQPRYEAMRILCGHAWPREGPAVSCPVYDDKKGKWKTITLRQSVYLTSMDKHLVFTSDGDGIHRIIKAAK